MEKRVFAYLALAFLVWGILGTVTAGYYFTQYNAYRGEYKDLLSGLNELSASLGNLSSVLSVTTANFSEVMNTLSLRVNALLSYGNGTKIWFNNTALPIGSTAFTAILAVAEVKYKDYGATLGILVTSINGLATNSTHGWFYWYRDMDNSTWTLPAYSCEQYILHRGDTIAFTYESFNPWPTSP